MGAGVSAVPAPGAQAALGLDLAARLLSGRATLEGQHPTQCLAHSK